MMAYDPTAGELRTHYAASSTRVWLRSGGNRPGSRAALEVRAATSPSWSSTASRCASWAEWMEAPAERLYGADLGSNTKVKSPC